jgi:hypothetical protein
MATDPFADIKQPKDFVEIGQPTFAELIWAKTCITSPAIGRSSPDVGVSLREIAFGKRCVDRLRPPTGETGTFSAIPPQGGSSTAGFTYDVRQIDNGGGSYKQKVMKLGAAKSATEFNALIANSIGAETAVFSDEFLAGCPYGSAPACSDNCDADEDDVCAVDLCICLDITGSMGNAITQIKSGIDEIIDLLRTAIGNNYRLSLVLVTAEDLLLPDGTIITQGGYDTFKTALAFDPNRCGDESLALFKAAMEPLTAFGGGFLSEYSAAAVKSAVTGGAGCWREGNVERALILITDASNNSASGVTITEAAEAAAACNIRIAYAATQDLEGVYPPTIDGDTYAILTDGINVQTGLSGSGLVSLLQTFIYSLCAESIPDPECEGGANIVTNGTFATDINGWVTTGTIPGLTAIWDGSFTSIAPADPISFSMRLYSGSTAEQTYYDLNPGDIVSLGYNWCLRAATGAVAADAPEETPKNSFVCGSAEFDEFITPFILNPDQEDGESETGFPAVCRVGVESGGITDYICTGTLIAPRFILTAAHCLVGVENFAARANFDGTEYNSVKVIMHPGWNAVYNESTSNDIAIIELSADVVGVTPVSISGPEPAYGVLNPVKIVGFGYTGDDSGPTLGTSGIKRSGDQIIGDIPGYITTNLMRYYFGPGESSTIFSDSGGPVFFNDSDIWYLSLIHI